VVELTKSISELIANQTKMMNSFIETTVETNRPPNVTDTDSTPGASKIVRFEGEARPINGVEATTKSCMETATPDVKPEIAVKSSAGILAEIGKQKGDANAATKKAGISQAGSRDHCG
jgi:hypothetical protein